MARATEAVRWRFSRLRRRGRGRAVSNLWVHLDARSNLLIFCSGAYCVMAILSLLDLPLTLPPDAPAREAGLETLTDGLAQYLSRCKERCLRFTVSLD